jgi:hypothetical protein
MKRSQPYGQKRRGTPSEAAGARRFDGAPSLDEELFFGATSLDESLVRIFVPVLAMHTRIQTNV